MVLEKIGRVLVFRNNFALRKMRYMVKLNERRIRWIIHEKMRGRGAGELALIQRVFRRRIEQLWQAYRRDSVIPALESLADPWTPPSA